MDFNSTVKGSALENFYPAGWDFDKIDKCCSNAPEAIFERQDFWHPDFEPIPCKNVAEFDMMMGHEIANEIKARGFKKAFVASDPDLIRFGITAKVTDLLDKEGIAEVYRKGNVEVL